MNARIAIVIGTVVAAGCGGSDKPAQSATSTSAYDAQSQSAGAGTTQPSAMPQSTQPQTTAQPQSTGHSMDMAPSETPPSRATGPINDRDGSMTSPTATTPMEQGNSASETKITAMVRQKLMSDKSLSMAAKNAKIITVGGKVTLRGAVKNDQEKSAIEKVARQTPGVTEVDNQLEFTK